ncbi:MAG: glycosyltransferase family 2 protein [Actinomycetota bacterium]|nr:glycosyltransferase family 2 protein [Actinomycetota bacterium]
MSISKLTIAVPVYNEEKRVERAMKELLAVQFPVEVEVVVVDDGSSDRTTELLQSMQLPANVRLVKHRRNQGKGTALRTALDVATGDVFVPFDADLEYDPADLPRLLKPIIEDDVPVVYGTRAFGSHTAFSFWYVLGNKMIVLFANILFNSYISDLETCYKMVRTDLLRSLNLKSSTFAIEAEITGKLLRGGYRPYEVPISYRARSRAEGKKIQWWDGVIALWTTSKARFGSR